MAEQGAHHAHRRRVLADDVPGRVEEDVGIRCAGRVERVERRGVAGPGDACTGRTSLLVDAGSRLSLLRNHRWLRYDHRTSRMPPAPGGNRPGRTAAAPGETTTARREPETASAKGWPGAVTATTGTGPAGGRWGARRPGFAARRIRAARGQDSAVAAVRAGSRPSAMGYPAGSRPRRLLAATSAGRKQQTKIKLDH
jgi:hypothetical protein